MTEPNREPQVAVWRSAARPAAVCMAGETASYRIRPAGEWVVGLLTAGAMRASRAGRTFDFGAGDLCVWDASAAHSGTVLGARLWSARLMLVEPPAFDEIADDPIGRFFTRPIGEPVVRRPCLAARFLDLHRGSRTADALQFESALLAWFIDLAEATGRTEAVSAKTDRDGAALARACALIEDDLAASPTLDDLAAAAGVPKFRLVRLFKSSLGLPPHRYRLAQRLRRARRLLERGDSVAAAAVAAGFFDQSHLHRHFTRATGMTPAGYRAVMRA